ncbi:MAG: alpha-amylase family glycosyl hydrolase, partial [Candidatus Acidiferrales bacterium]
WLMGVWRRSAESRRQNIEDPQNFAKYNAALPGWTAADVISSPYAVTGYVPDARIGPWESVDLVRKKLHARGIALYLDFVGNHTALDHPWTREHPEYYLLGTQDEFERDASLFFPVTSGSKTNLIARGKDPYFPPWRDVAQLNYFSPELRAAQIAELKNIASFCDGVRCDMAMLQLTEVFGRTWGWLLRGAPAPATEFWSEARAAVPELTLLAEAYWGTEAKLFDLGFSFAYDKVLYDEVRNMNAGAVHERITSMPGRQGDFARFLENHDEQRRAAAFPNDRLEADGTLMGTLPGMRFYHQGELEGRRISLPITLRVAADEPVDPVSEKFFELLLQITNEEVFHTGAWRILQVNAEGDAPPDGLIAYEWRSDTAWKMVVVNLADGTCQGRIPIGNGISADAQYLFWDQINEVKYPRSGAELHDVGLFVRRDRFQAHLFDITRVS